MRLAKTGLRLALRGRLTLITGGPGTGKTYTAARLLALLFATAAQPDQLRVALAAPTGKAAARLKQSIDQALLGLHTSIGQDVDIAALVQRTGEPDPAHPAATAPWAGQHHHPAGGRCAHRR